MTSLLPSSLSGQGLPGAVQELTMEQRDFEERASEYVQQHLDKHIQNFREMDQDHHGHGHVHEALSEDAIRAIAMEAARHDYIRSHMEDYLESYFADGSTPPPAITNAVCDNGGFEDDFLHYEGFIRQYSSGSDICVPTGLSSGFIPTAMPLTNRFQIIDTVLNGNTDPLVGIDMVRFGRKSLKLNSEIGHVDECDGDFGVDRVVKKFRVTEETKSFTVWYALALENPRGHLNRQPFLSIKCDLAPQDDLCFDADFLKCMDRYEGECPYDSIDVLNWTCHRINIPDHYIDSIATIEITVADCGQGAHFGYAYIDGMCESCAGSALGSIELPDNDAFTYKTCNEELLTICGRYTTPEICDSVTLDSIVLTGDGFYNLVIDPATETFCVDYYQEVFEELGLECVDLFAEIYFSTPTGTTFYEYSNIRTICLDDFAAPAASAIVGACNSSDPNSLSDDYYYVSLDIVNTNPAQSWTVERLLSNPYPGESGDHVLQSGSGNYSTVLGPFYIQEGEWTLTVDIDGCIYTIYITPPDYCSGCDVFNGFEVRNIKCDDQDPNKTTDDRWSFDLYVPGPIGQQYKIDNSETGIFNSLEPQPSFPISEGCKTFTLEYTNPVTDAVCKQEITVCPPRPCSDNTDCGDLEVYVNEINCEGEGPAYTVDLSVNYTGNDQLCFDPALGTSLLSSSSSLTTTVLTGPQPIQVKVCPAGSNCDDCEDYLCIKTIQVGPLEDCDRDLEGSFPSDKELEGRSLDGIETNEPKIYPNPFSNRIAVEHEVPIASYEIYDMTGQLIDHGRLDAKAGSIQLAAPKGIYVVKLITVQEETYLKRIMKLND